MTVQHTRHHTNNVKSLIARWSSMPANDVGEEIDFSQYTDRSIQVTGTFDGATLQLEGSNDGGLTWGVLQDFQGNNMVFSGPAAPRLVATVAALTRPSISGGGGATAVNVHAFVKE